MKIAKNIRREIAEAIVKQSAPDYDIRYFGESFAVDTNNDGTLDTVYFREANAAWNPWQDNAFAVSVEELYAGSAASFDYLNYESDLDDIDEDEAYEIAIDFAENELPEEIEIQSA